MYSLYLQTIRRQYVHLSSDSSAFLNAMRLLKYVLNCEQPYFIF
jgi:hypothetical protein